MEADSGEGHGGDGDEQLETIRRRRPGSGF